MDLRRLSSRNYNSISKVNDSLGTSVCGYYVGFKRDLTVRRGSFHIRRDWSHFEGIDPLYAIPGGGIGPIDPLYATPALVVPVVPGCSDSGIGGLKGRFPVPLTPSVSWRDFPRDVRVRKSQGISGQSDTLENLSNRRKRKRSKCEALGRKDRKASNDRSYRVTVSL